MNRNNIRFAPIASQLCRTASGFIVAAGLASGALADPLPSTPPSLPANNQVYADCRLPANIFTAIKTALQSANITTNPGVDYIVLFNIQQQNFGQPLSAGGATGPVICRSDEDNVLVGSVKESTPIPDGLNNTPAWPAWNPGDTIDITDTSQMILTQIRKHSNPGPNDIYNRLCLATNNNLDCFLLKNLPN